MIIKARGTVSIPKSPRSLGSVLLWCRMVNKSLQQLRDRCWEVPQSKGGVNGAASLGALVVTSSCPAFIAPPTDTVAEGTLRVWVTYGTINSRVSTNITDHFDITTEKVIYAKATFTTTGAFAVTSWAVEVQASSWAIPAPTGPRPDTGYYQLGGTYMSGDKLVLVNNGEGSLNVWPQVSGSLSGSTADTLIVWSR